MKFVKMCSSVFHFDVWDRLGVLIRSVPEVSLHINLKQDYVDV